MNKHRREITTEIIVGLFMFLVLFALGIFTIVLSRNSFGPTHDYEFVFPEISGLREGDNVYLRGMNVGRIQQTQLDDSKVVVYATLDVQLTLRHGYSIEVVNASMLGGKYLKVYEGPDDAQLLGDNVTILGAQPADIIEELGAAVDSLQAMIDAVNRGQGTLGKLLTDETMYNNMVVVSEDLKTAADRIERGEGTLGRLLVDDDGKLYDDAKEFMANLKTVSENLAEGKGALGQMITGGEESYKDLQAALTSIRSITEGVNNGEGTLGRLVRDAKLYDEATLLVEDVRAAVDDLREASPITSFGSVLFGAF